MPETLLAEQRQRRGDAIQNALDVDVDHLLPILHSQVVEARDRPNAKAGDSLRVTGISPGFVHTEFANSMTDPRTKASILEQMDKMRFRSIANKNVELPVALAGQVHEVH